MKRKHPTKDETVMKIFTLMNEGKYEEAKSLILDPRVPMYRPYPCQQWTDVRTLIHTAAIRSKDILEHLLDGGADIEYTDQYTVYTSLHYAVRYNKEECCKLLLDRGANIEARDWVIVVLFIYSTYFSKNKSLTGIKYSSNDCCL